jgi:hypothetical protein
MAIFFDAPVEPDALTTFVREVPFGSNLGLLNLFGRRDVETNTVDFAEIVRTNRMARYRSYDGRIHVSQRDTGSEKRVPLLPLSTSLNEGEYERLQLHFAALQGGNQGRLARAVYNDAEQLTREVQNRLEMAWGDVLTDGILTISEGGLTGSAGIADFGVPAGQKVTVGTAWATVASAPALSDLQTAVDTYIDANGFPPGYILTSNTQHRNLRRNAEIINAVRGSAAGVNRISASELSNLLADELQGITLLNPYDSSIDVDGVTTRTIPNDKVILLPPNLDDLGYTAWGVSATALELVNSNRSDLSFEQAAGIVGVVEKTGPPYRSFTYVDAVAMPILANGKLISILDVAP